jgi:hypothetical protein
MLPLALKEKQCCLSPSRRSNAFRPLKENPSSPDKNRCFLLLEGED